MLLKSAVGLNSPPAPASFTHTGRDTLPASLAAFASLDLKVLLNPTPTIECLKDVGHLTKAKGLAQCTLVGHLKLVFILNGYN